MRRVILLCSASTVLTLGLFLPLWAQEIPLTSDSYDHWMPQWSPDGNWIVYDKYDATGYDQIYKLPSAGGTEIALTSDSYEHEYPQWSPDGNWIVYYKDDATGYRQIYKVTSGVGIEEDETGIRKEATSIRVYPNPFTSFATIPGYEQESFVVYDVMGRKVGIYSGNRIGGELAPGVYFVLGLDTASAPARFVKVK